MTITINTLNEDCWNEIFSHIPRKNYSAMCCVSKEFPKPISYLATTEVNNFNKLIQIIRSMFDPSFQPETIKFKATTLFALGVEIRDWETKISQNSFILREISKDTSLHCDFAPIFYLASNKRNALSQDIPILIKHGYLKTAFERQPSSELFLPIEGLIQLAIRTHGQLTSLIPDPYPDFYLKQINQATTMAMLRLGKIEEALKQPLDDEARWELAIAYAKKGNIKKSFETFNSIHPQWQGVTNCLEKMAISFASEGHLEGVLKTGGLYQSINFEKITKESLDICLKEYVFEPVIFEALLKLNDDVEIEKYFSKRVTAKDDHDSLRLLLKYGKFTLAKKIDEESVILAEFKQGLRTEVDLLESELLQKNSQDLLKKLARIYAVKGEFEKALTLSEKILEKDEVLQKIAIELAKRKRFGEARKTILSIKDKKIFVYAQSRLANYAAVEGELKYLKMALNLKLLSIPLFGLPTEELFAFALHDTFDPKIILESTLLEKDDKKDICRKLIPFLTTHNKFQNIRILLHYLKNDLFTSSIFYHCGLACSENGFIDLALEIAEMISESNPELYYPLLMSIKLNRVK